MRTAIVGLLICSIVAVSQSLAAPAPFPKDRDRNPCPTTEQVEAHLRKHLHFSVQSIRAQGKAYWNFVGYPANYHYRLSEWVGPRQRVYLVKYKGKDHEGRPQLEVIDLEQTYLGLPR